MYNKFQFNSEEKGELQGRGWNTLLLSSYCPSYLGLLSAKSMHIV